VFFVRLEQFLKEQNGNNCTGSGTTLLPILYTHIVDALYLGYSTASTQGVLGGMCQISGECSLS